MNYKICTKCEKSFEATKVFFYKQKKGRFGLHSRCKACFKKCNAHYYMNDYENRLKTGKEYYRKNRKLVLDRMKKYRQTEKGRVALKKHYHLYRQYYNERGKEYYYRNRLSCCISGRIRSSLVGNKNGQSWETLVDYTLGELKQHLESLFQSKMSWDNYGEWHIDHKKPIALFNITDYNCDDFKECWALNNLQPLWASENCSKGAKYMEDLYERKFRK